MIEKDRFYRAGLMKDIDPGHPNSMVPYYLIGVIIALIVFITVGVIAGRKVKDTNDYYVAGRRAPIILIVGSLIASFLSTGAFLGDTGEVYGGFFMGIVIVGVLQASG